MKRREFLVAGGALAASVALPARAAYPEKPVRYIIAFAPGGESDIAARLQQQVYRRKWGQELVIESKPGAGGALAWTLLNQLPGDGYVIMGTNLPHLVLQPLEGNVDYRTDDITNVHFFNYTPDAIVVRSESPFRTYQDLVAAAKAKPATLNLAGSGTNSANHAAHERLDHEAGVKTTYVPFKGTGDLIASLLGGHVDGAMSYSSLGLAQRGRTRLLAVATPQRLPYFPDVPTFRELGIDWVDGAYRGIGVPKSTPEAMRKRISAMFAEINTDADFRKAMTDQGLELVDVTYEQMPAFMAERKKAYLSVAKLMGLAK
ncbi:MAG TPA: tripartite tricarboxylate transporter substrate binding protein [Usitatibacter sp.]|jgi:tripartite-type tricarboxylate transporter receptor subunit TctC|nr:tripartite tricarboxylate transporter substrate binding protein [Usitatibacter sp.]